MGIISVIISGNRFSFLELFMGIIEWALKSETNAESISKFLFHCRNNYRKLILFLEIMTEMDFISDY